MSIRVISVNVGRPQTVQWHGEEVLTSIWKTPVEDAVRAAHNNLFGDEQSDLTVHGGPRKAVYAYPREHYVFWRRELPHADLPWGAFGENLTVDGLLESDVRVGDRFRVGSAELVVTQPRMPCFKLGIRFGDDGMVRRFMRSGRSGFYFSIAVEGDIRAGDAIELLSRSDDGPTIAEMFASRTS
jgi:MOSC domain-containing protein YiiM